MTGDAKQYDRRTHLTSNDNSKNVDYVVFINAKRSFPHTASLASPPNNNYTLGFSAADTGRGGARGVGTSKMKMKMNVTLPVPVL